MNSFYFFLLCTLNAWKHNLALDPKEPRTFYEHVASKGLQLTADISVSSEGTLSYRIKEPNKPLGLWTPLSKSNGLLKFDGAGTYQIELLNTHSDPMRVSLGTYVDKEFEVDEDTRYIRNVISKLKDDLSRIYNANVKVKEIKEVNVRKVARDRRWLLGLIILPLLYVGIGVVSLKIQKRFFMPKK